MDKCCGTDWIPPTIEEAKQKLGRVMHRGADYVALYSRRNRWAFEAVALMQEHGYLGPIEEFGNEQYTEWRFRFTDKAREELQPSK